MKFLTKLFECFQGPDIKQEIELILSDYRVALFGSYSSWNYFVLEYNQNGKWKPFPVAMERLIGPPERDFPLLSQNFDELVSLAKGFKEDPQKLADYNEKQDKLYSLYKEKWDKEEAERRVRAGKVEYI